MCAPPGLFADTTLVRYVESTTYKMEETPCHHQGRLPKGRHSLGALERRVGPPAAMWRDQDVVGPTALRHPSGRTGARQTPGIQRRVPGARLGALTNKAGMSFRFRGMMLATPGSIKDSHRRLARASRAGALAAAARHGALPRFRITQVRKEDPEQRNELNAPIQHNSLR